MPAAGQITSAGDLRITELNLHATFNDNHFQAGTVTVDAGAVLDIAAQGAFGSTPTKALHVMGVVNTSGPSVIVNSLTGATRWGLAEGRAGGAESYQTYILLANLGTTDAKVTLKFLADRLTAASTQGAAPVTRVVDVPAQRRVNVPVDPTGAAGDPATTFGTLITSDQPIVVERAMYWNVNGEVWAAGTNATATRLP